MDSVRTQLFNDHNFAFLPALLESFRDSAEGGMDELLPALQSNVRHATATASLALLPSPAAVCSTPGGEWND